MLMSELRLTQIPPSLAATVELESMRWEAYTPADTAEEDAPFGKKWWCYMYWMPEMKRDLQYLAMQFGVKAVERKIIEEWGADPKFFYRHYGTWIKTLRWMARNQNKRNYAGETV